MVAEMVVLCGGGVMPGHRQVLCRVESPGMPFSQMMMCPCDLSLVTTPQGPRMRWQPVPEIAVLHGVLADADLYARDPKKFADTSAKLEKAQAELSVSEEKWLELEMLREELER